VVVLHVVAPLARVVLHREDLFSCPRQMQRTKWSHSMNSCTIISEQARLVVVVQQLLLRAADVDVPPPAAVRVLEDARHPDVLDDRVPVERVLRLRSDSSWTIPGTYSLCGSTTVFGCAIPSFASEAPKNLSSADHMKGLLTTVTPCSTACFR
jgi:hypothetical protein